MAFLANFDNLNELRLEFVSSYAWNTLVKTTNKLPIFPWLQRLLLACAIVRSLHFGLFEEACMMKELELCSLSPYLSCAHNIVWSTFLKKIPRALDLQNLRWRMQMADSNSIREKVAFDLPRVGIFHQVPRRIVIQEP
jgi:hypothetical protein